LQLNGVPTDNLRAINVTPYFEDGETIKFVKFPGFNETGINPTDAKLFVDISTFLGSSERRHEQIQAILYIHPITYDDSKATEMKHNARMLEKIVKGITPNPDAMQNVVIVTVKWDKIPESDRAKMENSLRSDLMDFYGSNPFMRHDGTKFSAQAIVHYAKNRIATLFGLQKDLLSPKRRPSATSAGKELSDYIAGLIQVAETRKANLRRKIGNTEDDDEAQRLEADREQLNDALAHLDQEDTLLTTPIAWGQAAVDNEALERAIEERRELATKDWKAEYDTLKVEYDNLSVEIGKLKGELANISGAYDTMKAGLNVAIRAHTAYDTRIVKYPDWLAYKVDEVFYTSGVRWRLKAGDVYLVRNSAGRIGVVWSKNFTVV